MKKGIVLPVDSRRRVRFSGQDSSVQAAATTQSVSGAQLSDLTEEDKTKIARLVEKVIELGIDS
jgi:hypothetical protein